MEDRFGQILSEFKKQYTESVLKDFLPGQKISSLSSTNECLDQIAFSSQNIYYKGSDYYKDVDRKKFIHFTSLEKLKEIISSNSIRLYDLNYPDDPHEIEFIAKGIDNEYSDYNYKILKSEFFSFSVCEYPMNDDDEHTMWRLYGNDGNGVGLVISFLNNADDWYDFNFAKIQYNNPDKFALFLKSSKNFIEKIKLDLKLDTAINDRQIIYSLLPLLAFHKHSIYGNEREYRLLFRNNKTSSNKLEPTYILNKRDQLSSFVSLNLLDNRNRDSADPTIPLIKIDQIILGYRHPEFACEKLEDSITNVLAYNNKKYSVSNIDVKMTELKYLYFN